MRERLLGYWALSWVGLISNIIALPIIALIISYGPPLKIANITLAISLGWPAAIAVSYTHLTLPTILPV